MGADGTGGRLVGGSENGTLTVYNPEDIMNSGAEAVVGQSDKHTGPVRALDFNPFQVNVCSSDLLCPREKDFSFLLLWFTILIFLIYSLFPLSE